METVYEIDGDPSELDTVNVSPFVAPITLNGPVNVNIVPLAEKRGVTIGDPATDNVAVGDAENTYVNGSYL